MGRVALNSKKLTRDVENKSFLGVYLVCGSEAWAVGLSEGQDLDRLVFKHESCVPRPLTPDYTATSCCSAWPVGCWFPAVFSNRPCPLFPRMVSIPPNAMEPVIEACNLTEQQ